MSCLMSIDLGTSSVRCMLMDESGEVLASKGEAYDVDIPEAGHAEQDPEVWYEKTKSVIQYVLSAVPGLAKTVEGISFSGQMHGLVCVDKWGKELCPAIIWQDQRTSDEIKEIYDKLGREFIASQTQNTITTGFLIASLYWIYKNKPDVYSKIYKVMLPKDYIKLRLTGRIVTDYSDAAGSLAFDNINVCWAKGLIEGLSLDVNLFPECLPSEEVIGSVSSTAAKETGLVAGVKVVNGGSDQCMQGIGNGIISEGTFAANIGTGGQISAIISKPLFDPGLRTNTFSHVLKDRWNIMGACLCSGASLKWLTKQIIGITDYDILNAEAGKLPCGSEGLLYLPYLVGERTPHQDPDARGVLFGLTLKHTNFHMVRAVMEGVAFSLKDCMDVVLGTGIQCDRVIASGGGANSEVWLQIQADILERDIYKSMASEQACIGAAITAGVGTGVYKSFEEACGSIVRMDKRVYHPIAENVKQYREYYEVFKELYCNNRELFRKLK